MEETKSGLPYRTPPAYKPTVASPPYGWPHHTLHGRGSHFQLWCAAARNLDRSKTPVVQPCDAFSLSGALEAMKEGLIRAILVGPRGKIEKAAKEAKLSLDGIEIVDAPHSHAAAAQSVKLADGGKVCLL